jgi:lipoic acid synthetase
LPGWFRQELPDNKARGLMHLFSQSGARTVCREAKCPNLNYCFRNNKATFMILGDTCTRNCRFCGVNKAEGEVFSSTSEPSLISELVKRLGMKYVVITSVSRDDLTDAGAGEFAATIKSIRETNREVKIEVLIPDFQGNISSLRCVLDAGPDVLGHNLETVRRLYRDLRPQADYQRSLGVLKAVKELRPEINSKSSLMLGLGEREEEVLEAMRGLREVDCDMLTLGQYLAPSADHYPVKEFIPLEQFCKYRDKAIALGFKSVASAPLVRSSFKAEETFKELSLCMT